MSGPVAAFLSRCLPLPLRPRIALGLALQRDLDHRDDRVGEKQAHDAEQGTEQYLRTEAERNAGTQGKRKAAG